MKISAAYYNLSEDIKLMSCESEGLGPIVRNSFSSNGGKDATK